MKNEVSSYIEHISLLVVGIFLLGFPVLFTTITTDSFIVPKQLLLIACVLLAFLLFGLKMITDGMVRFRRTPFDLPLLLFAGVVFLSSLLAVNRADSLLAFIPFFFAVLLYFVIINLARTEEAVLFLAGALTAGTSVATIVTILSVLGPVLKRYILPFPSTQIQTFTPVGNLLDQAVLFSVTLAIAIRIAYPALVNLSKKKKISEVTISASIPFAVGGAITLIGLIVTIYELVVLQHPVLLPFETGFQTAFASISQDSGRTLQGFLLGSGFGTYGTDFTRFRLPTFNLNAALWATPFNRSSSFILELLATTGVVGFVAFGFLIYRIIKTGINAQSQKRNLLLFGLVGILVISFLLPFGFVTQTILIVVIALFAAEQGLTAATKHFFDIELGFVASKKHFLPIAVETVEPGEPSIFARIDPKRETTQTSLSKLLPVSFFLVFLAIAGSFSYFVYRFAASDLLFQKSLVTAAANNGLETYNSQTQAIGLFPWRDGYYRIYSQINLSLANSLAQASQAQSKGKTTDTQTQQTIFTLIQQAITAGRNATTLSPETATNWDNLAGVYRNLIGFGQNADQFTILAMQQAIALDPSNPQYYLGLGGIYYQLGQWDNAQNQFQIAARLKPDYANAYYNLGHALEQKGDLVNALAQYQAVKQLLGNDTENIKKIDAEISALQKKIAGANLTDSGQAASSTQSAKTNAPAQTQPLGISSPSDQFPNRNPQAEIPGPTASPTPSATPTPTTTLPSGSPTPTITQTP